jgi:outer membrane protein OmpA-like peptidoglycan-associated protein
MATRAVSTLVLTTFVLLSIILFPMNSGFAQDTKGRWAFGIHGGANNWIDDYNKRVIGEGGELMVRYGVSRALSVGLVTGYEELKSNQNPELGGVTYLKLQAIPGSVMGWIHFAPDKPVNPYLYFGVGAMLYKRTTGGNLGVTSGQFQTSLHLPVGIGVEVFASKNLSIAVDAGYRVLDNYTDGLNVGKIDGYATAKAGVNLYFGTSAAEKEELAKLEARRIKDSTDAEALRVQKLAEAEAQRLKALAEANAQRIKDSTEAEGRRLAELNARRLQDTVLALERGKTVILKGVSFATNKATLTGDSETILELALKSLAASPAVNVLIVGHTDNVGSAASNKKLSLRRAQAVKTWLVRKGIPATRLSVAGKGFDEPIDDNTTPEGRLNNRRIEFRVLK